MSRAWPAPTRRNVAGMARSYAEEFRGHGSPPPGEMSRAWPAPTGGIRNTPGSSASRCVVTRGAAFIREIVGNDLTDAGSRCTGMCSGVSETRGHAARSAGATTLREAQVLQREARVLQRYAKRRCCNAKRGCYNATRSASAATRSAGCCNAKRRMLQRKTQVPQRKAQRPQSAITAPDPRAGASACRSRHT